MIYLYKVQQKTKNIVVFFS